MREAQAADGGRMGPVLRLPRPSDKCLAGTLQPPPAKQVGETDGRVPLALARHQNLRFLEEPESLRKGGG